jgi:hypothetical protein
MVRPAAAQVLRPVAEVTAATAAGPRPEPLRVGRPVLSPAPRRSTRLAPGPPHLAIAGRGDGKRYIQIDDKHSRGPGAVGVWTKADSVTAFDDFVSGAARWAPLNQEIHDEMDHSRTAEDRPHCLRP